MTVGFNARDLKYLVSRAGADAPKEGSTIPDISKLSLTESDRIIGNSSNWEKLQSVLSSTPKLNQTFNLTKPNLARSAFAGYDTIKTRLQKVVSGRLTNENAFQKLGIKPPSGILLYGPSGCGKTLLAQTLALESPMTYITVKA